MRTETQEPRPRLSPYATGKLWVLRSSDDPRRKTGPTSQPKAGVAKAKPEVIKVGLDLHARQVTECRQLDGSTPKPPQQWEPAKLLAQVEAWVQAGIKVYSCYEAGACGYWFHREQRSVVRHREQLMRHRRRAEAQGRALALTQGVVAPVG